MHAFEAPRHPSRLGVVDVEFDAVAFEQQQIARDAGETRKRTVALDVGNADAPAEVFIAGIRTEQCCETTARHASDEGWEVDFCSAATLTFDMRTPRGALLSAEAITERTETVLADRFATLVSVQQALERAA